QTCALPIFPSQVIEPRNPTAAPSTHSSRHPAPFLRCGVPRSLGRATAELIPSSGGGVTRAVASLAGRIAAAVSHPSELEPQPAIVPLAAGLSGLPRAPTTASAQLRSSRR